MFFRSQKTLFVAATSSCTAAAVSLCSCSLRDDAVEEARARRVARLQELVATRNKRQAVLSDLREKQSTPCGEYNVVCKAMVYLATRELDVLPREWAESEARALSGGKTAAEKMAHLEKFGGAEFTEEAIEKLQGLRRTVLVASGDVGDDADLDHPWLKALENAEAVGLVDGEVLTMSFEMDAQGNMLQSPEAAERDARRIKELQALREKSRAGALLLFVAPPFGAGAKARLDAYLGDRVAYVGEARGGLHASDGFFDTLEAGWDLDEAIDLPPWGDAHPKLYLLSRPAPPAPTPRKKRWWHLWTK